MWVFSGVLRCLHGVCAAAGRLSMTHHRPRAWPPRAAGCCLQISAQNPLAHTPGQTPRQQRSQKTMPVFNTDHAMAVRAFTGLDWSCASPPPDVPSNATPLRSPDSLTPLSPASESGAADGECMPGSPAASSSSGSDAGRGQDEDVTLAAKFRFGKLLGRGSYASVYLVHERPRPEDRDSGVPLTLRPFAMKVIDKANIKDRVQLRVLLREIRIMKRLDHANIVRLEEVYETPSRVYLQMELAEGGELFDRIAEKHADHFSERDARDIAFQIADALAYLHKVGVVHRDLKPENILVAASGNDQLPSPAPSSLLDDFDGTSLPRNPAPAQPVVIPFPYPHPASMTVKLADFGIATTLGFPPSAPYSPLQTLCGSFPYVAPEILVGPRDRGYSFKVDVFSMAVIVYVLLSGHFPMATNNTGEPETSRVMLKRIMDGGWKEEMRGPEWAWVSAEGREWVSRCLEIDPEKRWSAAVARDAKWFKTFLDGDDPHERAIEDAAASDTRGEWGRLAVKFATKPKTGNAPLSPVSPLSATMPGRTGSPARGAGEGDRQGPPRNGSPAFWNTIMHPRRAAESPKPVAKEGSGASKAAEGAKPVTSKEDENGGDDSDSTSGDSVDTIDLHSHPVSKPRTLDILHPRQMLRRLHLHVQERKKVKEERLRQDPGAVDHHP
ncbi:kinase-like domain-containing protein [Hyaloraphidium curvatum]|nr:kinase-like domain-containing protein [Hyaloraphidium curvatum]